MSLLRARGLTLTLGRRQRVLGGIDLGIGPGERVALVGPNGAGKTSLLRCLAGAIAPQSGRIEFEGAPVQAGRFTPGLALLFQQAEDQLFCPTVAEDVAFGARNMGLRDAALEAAVARALAAMEIAHLAGRMVHQLSGGEKRLASLAGALIMTPRVLLLDEPSAGLDLRHRRRLIGHLSALDQAMILASHDLEMVLELCPRVVLIDGGRIVADGVAPILLGDPALMAAHGQEVPHSLAPHRGRGHDHRRRLGGDRPG